MHEATYKNYKNKLNRLLVKAERDHYEQLLKDNQNNMKKSWQILKEVINKRKDVSSCSKFIMGGKVISDKKTESRRINRNYEHGNGQDN